MVQATLAGLLFIFVSVVQSSGQAIAREWTNSKGQSVEASIHKIENGKVHLRTEKKVHVYPIDSLSESDQAYCEKVERLGRFWEQLNQGRWFLVTLGNAFPISVNDDKLNIAKFGEHTWSINEKLLTIKSTEKSTRTFELKDTLSGFRGITVKSGELVQLLQVVGPTTLKATVSISRPPYFRLRVAKGSHGWLSDLDKQAKGIDLKSDASFAEGEKLEVQVGEPLEDFSPFGAVIVPHIPAKEK